MVEKVTAFQFSKRFKKEYNNLPKEIQKAFDAKPLAMFLHQAQQGRCAQPLPRIFPLSPVNAQKPT